MKKIALILTAFLLMFGLAFAVVENLEVPPKQYTGNGVTTDFPITFDYTDDSDLTVSFVNDSDGSIDAWTQDALGDQGYTIVSDEVIANTAPDNGRLVIDGETPLTQTLNLKNNRATPAELYESALDKGILATRDVKAILDRTMTAPATADPDVDYTAPEYEAGSYWQWHPTLKELRNADIADSTTTIGTDVGDIVELVDDGSGNGVFPITTLQVATTTDSGIVELSTDAEAIAGTDTGRVITPSSLRAVVVDRVLPITASVGSNAITVSLNPVVLDFRSSTLGSGTINTRSISSALALVISSGSTLGTVDAIQSRIILIAIDNSGTVELAAVNSAGENNLDETTLISTTAEGGAGGADTKNVIYSTTARTSVPFRVVGYVESTQATAGTWATAPSTIQGYGGLALAAMSSLGYSQTIQDVTASRSFGVTYYNTTGKAIFAMVSGTTSIASNIYVVMDGVTINGDYAAGGGERLHLNIIIPPGAAYSFNLVGGTPALLEWFELR